MTRILCICLILLSANYIFAAGTTPEIRNAKQAIENFTVTEDTAGICKFLHTININFTESKDSALLALLLKVSAKEEKLDSHSLKQLYFVIRKFYESDENKTKYFEYSLKLYKVLSKTSDHEGLMWILIDIGNIFYSESDYEQAYVFYNKAEWAAQKWRSNYGLSIIYLNYGMIDERRKDYQKSLQHYQISSAYRLISGNVKVVSSTYAKVAMAWLNLQQPDSCLHYIHKAEDYYYNKGEKTSVLIDMPFNIDYVYSEYYVSLKDYEKAIYHIRKAGEYCRKNKLTSELIASNSFEATFLYKAGRHEQAIACIRKMLPFYKEKGLLEQQKYAYRVMRNCYSALRQFKKADEITKKYVLIDDSMHQLNIKSEQNMIRSIAAVYESDTKLNSTRKDLQIAKVNNKIRVKQRNRSVLIAVSSLTGVLILAVLFFNLRSNKVRLLSMHRQLIRQNKAIKINTIELKRSNELKNKLFSIIAHDLRNPLNRLMVELAIVKNSIADRHLTDPIENTLKETIHLFESLLEWSKTDQTQNIFSPAKVSLDENINKIILFYLPEIQAREIKIVNKSAALSTFADQNIVQTLFRNLLGNAIASVSKNGEKGTIEIETNVTGDDQIEIVLSDSGPGFPQEVIEKFNDEKFDINVKSKGLGLSICKVLAKMSGWKMEISNKSPMNGARISILVPLFKGEILPQPAEIHKQLSETTKVKLQPVKAFKFYQTSQIRMFLKSLEFSGDAAAQEWVRLLEKSVHDGDQQGFSNLLSLLDSEAL